MFNGFDAGWAYEDEEFAKGVLFPTVCVYEDGFQVLVNEEQ